MDVIEEAALDDGRIKRDDPFGAEGLERSGVRVDLHAVDALALRSQ